MKYNLLKN